MARFYQNIGLITANQQVFYYVWEGVLMLLLLCGSAFFSGVETAFFNLTRRQIKQLRESDHKFQNLAARLRNNPRQLLSCLLLGNMMVNVLFYAVASVLTVRAEQQIGAVAAAAVAFGSFCLLVLFGEILPKSSAFTNSSAISTAVALPVFLCLQIFRPVLFTLRLFIVEPALRLILGPAKSAKPISTAEFKLLIEHVRKRGLITADENKLLAETIELGFLKVRHVMRPRVDMIACTVTDSSEKIREIMQKNHLTKLPVYTGTIDNIIGLVYLRRLLLEPEQTVDKFVQEVNFVPEQKTVESLLEFFRKSHTDTAVVVDEYGGIAGSVSLEDIAEELFGPIEFTENIEPIEQIGPLTYRLAGNLAIHDWAESFGIEPVVETRISTIAGLVTALLGKIPQSGDVAYLKNLKFTVERVQKRRIETLILTFEANRTDD